MSGQIGDAGLTNLKSFPLEEGVIASPICVDGRLFLKSDKHLFCFGEE
jgi:hypothetical protein